MKKQLLILIVLMVTHTIFAQKVIENPNYISGNISGKVTRIEVKENETILHFQAKIPVGSWIYIPSESYIEDSSKKGKRLYITKTDGIVMDKRHTIVNNDELRYKLYFPALDKDVKHINFGESNNGGNWFIFKLDLTNNGLNFLYNLSESITYSGVKVVEGRKIASFNIANGNSIVLPQDLPNEFFGNWYDKYGTLIMITTPDYIMSDDRIQYYRNIQKLGNTKFNISSTAANFEILSVDSKNMVVRSDRLINLKRMPSDNKLPKFIKGDWIHKNKVGKINITDTSIYNSEGTFGNKKSNIDHVVVSQSGNTIWMVVYNEGYYYMYLAEKINGDYVLTPRGYPNAQYKKVNN
jgi:hypothetical protein